MSLFPAFAANVKPVKSFFDRLRGKSGAAGSSTDANDASSTDAELLSESVDEAALLAEAEAAMAEEYLELELGDFLQRIPFTLLCKGPHDPAAPLRFELADLAGRLVRGETTIPVSSIYWRMPQIFSVDEPPPEEVTIRFPWIKVLKLMREAATAAGDQPPGESSLQDRLRKKRAEFIDDPAKAEAAAQQMYSEEGLAQVGLQKTSDPEAAPKKGAEKFFSDSYRPAEPNPEPVGKTAADPFVELQRIRSEYERQIVKLKEDRQTAVTHRDKAIAEISKIRQEALLKIQKITAERDVALKTVDTLKLERSILIKKIKVLSGAE